MDYTKLSSNPNNPRRITEHQFEKLKKSIDSFTKMLEIRPIAYDEDGVIWGGNMRYEALKSLGIEMKPAYFKELKGFTLEEKRQFAIRDNVELGEWDDEILANEWSDLPLKEWGILTGGWQEDIDVNAMWEGMPEFGNEANFKTFKDLIIHFDNQEAVDDFAELVKQKISPKTKYIWYPEKEKDRSRDLVYTNEDES